MFLMHKQDLDQTSPNHNWFPLLIRVLLKQFLALAVVV